MELVSSILDDGSREISETLENNSMLTQLIT
jgi:hypothetical protein